MSDTAKTCPVCGQAQTAVHVSEHAREQAYSQLHAAVNQVLRCRSRLADAVEILQRMALVIPTPITDAQKEAMLDAMAVLESRTTPNPPKVDK